MQVKKWLLSLTATLCCLTTAFTACGGIYLDSSFSSSSSTTESTSEDSMFSENSSIENSSAESSFENSSMENNSTENSSENSSVEDSSADSSGDTGVADFPTVNAGDVVTIEKGAVFTHGNVKAVFMVKLSWTYNGGNSFSCSATV